MRKTTESYKNIFCFNHEIKFNGPVICSLPEAPMWDLYKCTGPTVGHLQHFFFLQKDKCPTNAPGGGGGECAQLELTEP